MAVWLPILAQNALTFFTAFHPGSVAFTVIFAARRFLASTSLLRHEGRNSLKSPRVSEVRHLLSLVNLVLALRFVATARTFASLITNFSLGKALAIHLQAVDFGAFAARLALKPWREIEL